MVWPCAASRRSGCSGLRYLSFAAPRMAAADRFRALPGRDCREKAARDCALGPPLHLLFRLPAAPLDPLVVRSFSRPEGRVAPLRPIVRVHPQISFSPASETSSTVRILRNRHARPRCSRHLRRTHELPLPPAKASLKSGTTRHTRGIAVAFIHRHGARSEPRPWIVAGPLYSSRQASR